MTSIAEVNVWQPSHSAELSLLILALGGSSSYKRPLKTPSTLGMLVNIRTSVPCGAGEDAQHFVYATTGVDPHFFEPCFQAGNVPLLELHPLWHLQHLLKHLISSTQSCRNVTVVIYQQKLTKPIKTYQSCL